MLGFWGVGSGGGHGTGDVPIAIKPDAGAAGAVPAITRRTEIAVSTTSSASKNVRTRFFI